MSTFYGMIQGNRGPATKGGSRTSGITAAGKKLGWVGDN